MLWTNKTNEEGIMGIGIAVVVLLVPALIAVLVTVLREGKEQQE